MQTILADISGEHPQDAALFESTVQIVFGFASSSLVNRWLNATMDKSSRGRAPTTTTLGREKLFKTIIVQANAVELELGISPSQWQNGHAGWFLGKQYVKLGELGTLKMKMVEIRNWPVKISTLRPEAQFLAYQSLLKTASLGQMAAYYRLHCEQLDEARCCVAHELTVHRENDKQFRQVFPTFFSHQDDIASSSKLKKAAHAVQVADKHYRLRAAYRAHARGLELLIEKCEDRLQTSENFTPVDWRSYSERPRWADGRRGWTGLRPSEVDLRTVDTVKEEEITSRKTWRDSVDAVLRARYARFFPRVADRRLATYALEDRRDGEVVRAGGIEHAKVTASKASV